MTLVTPDVTWPLRATYHVAKTSGSAANRGCYEETADDLGEAEGGHDFLRRKHGEVSPDRERRDAGRRQPRLLALPINILALVASA